MKLHMLCVLVFGVFSASSLMSMEEESKGRLNFILNNKYCIRSYSNQGLGFLVAPSTFVGRSILDVIPLNDDDKTAVKNALEISVKAKETVTVSYTLREQDKNITFMAAITALKRPKKEEYIAGNIRGNVYIIEEPMKHDYFVKVTQVNNQ